MAERHAPTISVVIPVHRGGAAFRRCLEAVTGSVPPANEIIVVADGDPDDSARVAREFDVKVVQLPRRGGPSCARNVGARQAHGDIVFFLDADVVLRPDSLQQAAAILCAKPDVAAVFGSYDDAPGAPNFLSQYKNLLHHFTHQTAREEASTFFSACGAIRRDVFLAVGGFDEGYTRAAIQDIELGHRLRRAGHRIRLCKSLQVTHLKRWSVRSLLISDFFDRALPWSELIIRRQGFINDLNLRHSSRVSVGCVFGALAALIAAWWKPSALAVAAALALLLLVLNAPLYRFYYHQRGLRFTAQAVPWHWLYFLYSGLAFGIAALRCGLARTRGARTDPGPRQAPVGADTLHFKLYDVGVVVDCTDAEIRKRVADDFNYFRSENVGEAVARVPDVCITAYRQAPSYDDLPPLPATIYSPRNVCYSDGDVTYIDYFGRALSIYDRGTQRLQIYSDDVHLLHEIIYGTILSRASEQLERRRLHRIHALGVEANGQAALFVMPSGGGKTTLALEFLKRPQVYRLISEDSPLVDAAGRVRPFPLRLGVVAESPEARPPFPPEHLTYLERMEFGPKYLVSLAAFDGALATAPSAPRFLFIGRRTLGRGCSIQPAGRWRGFHALVESMIVGVGLYQGVEFLLRTSVLDLARLTGTIVSRVLRAGALLRQCEVLTIDLGREPQVNMDTILSFLAARNFGR